MLITSANRNYRKLQRRSLLLSVASPVLALALAPTAFSQATEISDARTAPVSTSTAGTDGAANDVTVVSGGTFTLTDVGPALVLDSDNTLTHGGAITIDDTDGATGLEVQTGNMGSLIVTGSVTVQEDYTATDTDSNRIIDGAFALGTGRTGILISGADTFTGPVDISTGSSISVEGNDSAGFRLVSGAGVIGNITLAGQNSVIGDNARSVDIAGNVTGNVDIGGTTLALGENAQAITVSGDVSDRLTIRGTVANTGYRPLTASPIGTRLGIGVRDLLDGEDTLEGSNAVAITGNVAGGIHMAQTFTTTTDDEGVETTTLSGTPSITQTGGAVAFLISGSGAPIMIGLVADITDSTDADFNANLQYGLVNEGTITSNGILDDISGTAVRVEDATIENGFFNAGQITTQTYRSPVPATGTNVAGDVAHAYGITFGSGANVAQINNTSLIGASSNEALDESFADQDNPLDANPVFATAIQIESGATVNTVTNTGTINAQLVGRAGSAFALVDQSGTLAVIDNQGIIRAGGQTSDPNASASDTPPTFTLVAIDVSMNTSGVTITQSQFPDPDLTDEFSPPAPIIVGDILLGSGDDNFTISAGVVSGDVSFGDGTDALTISGGSILRGSITDTDGLLTLDVSEGSSVILTDAVALNVTNASFDATSTFSPIIDAGAASTLTASGTLTFAEGAIIAPTLSDVIGNGGQFTLAEAGTLSIAGDRSNFQAENPPWLYDTSVDVNGNALVATLTLRNTTELGLDAPQAQAFNAVFGAISGDRSLGGAFAAISEEAEFNAAYNQLLPEFAAAVHQFVHSNVDGATGAVATHLKNARLSDAKPGGAWIEEFAYFADRELAGLSEAYRGYGFGFTGGFDTEIGPFHTAGINLGFSSTEVEDVIGQDDPLTVTTLQGGLYAGYETGKFGVDLYVGGGYSSFENNRNVQVGNFNQTARGDWNGTHVNTSIGAGYDINMGRYFARPSVNVSYLSLTEDAYSETGSDAIRFNVDERKSEVGTATAMMTFGAKFEGDRLWYAPGLRVGYRNDFQGGGIMTNANFAGSGGLISVSSQEFPDSGLILGVTFAAGSKYSSFGFDYDADLRDGYNRHIARLVLRLLF